MSSEPFIRARNLGKRFTLFDRPSRRIANLLWGAGGGVDHWAVRGVDLDLKRGDCLGIVGRNGAGKSTLLELVCGVLTPSEGTVEVSGRIAALLQLGAGFNPDFTGRENVFLSASLYGLSEEATRARMAQIEDFAGIGEHIDRPVREYSSGMYARLAFSVCAHVDADILVVDEILGVGDVRFQQKSMRFLRGFRKRGIVLFVSHNEHSVAALCRRAVRLDRGRVAAAGGVGDVLNDYRREMSRQTGDATSFSATTSSRIGHQDRAEARVQEAAFDPDDPPAPDHAAVIGHVLATDTDGYPLPPLEGGEQVGIEIGLDVLKEISRPRVVFALRNGRGQIVLAGDSLREASMPERLSPGASLSVKFGFRLPFVPSGSYAIDAFVLSGVENVLCHAARETAASLQVLSRHVSGGMANVALRRAEIQVGEGA